MPERQYSRGAKHRIATPSDEADYDQMGMRGRTARRGWRERGDQRGCGFRAAAAAATAARRRRWAAQITVNVQAYGLAIVSGPQQRNRASGSRRDVEFEFDQRRGEQPLTCPLSQAEDERGGAVSGDQGFPVPEPGAAVRGRSGTTLPGTRPGRCNRWEIRLAALDESEMAALEQFFLDNQGGFGNFAFTDPWDGISIRQLQFGERRTGPDGHGGNAGQNLADRDRERG